MKRRLRPAQRSEAAVSIELAGARLDYRLRRSSARRTLALRVAESGAVVVNAPMRLAVGEIEAFLRRHADWVRQRLATLPAAPVWRDGLVLPYLGGDLDLNWREEAATMPCRQDGAQLLVVASATQLPARVEAWYREAARREFLDRLPAYSARLGVAPPPFRLSDARTRWGSLSPRGAMSLNWRLVKAPASVIDYVICHELVHLRHYDHSPAFWREVARLFPDFEAARAHLRQHGRRYFEF